MGELYVSSPKFIDFDKPPISRRFDEKFEIGAR